MKYGVRFSPAPKKPIFRAAVSMFEKCPKSEVANFIQIPVRWAKCPQGRSKTLAAPALAGSRD